MTVGHTTLNPATILNTLGIVLGGPGLHPAAGQGRQGLEVQPAGRPGTSDLCRILQAY